MDLTCRRGWGVVVVLERNPCDKRGVYCIPVWVQSSVCFCELQVSWWNECIPPFSIRWWIWAHEYTIAPIKPAQCERAKQTALHRDEWGHNPAKWQDMWLSTPSPNLHIRAGQTGGASEQISSDRQKHPPVALSSVWPTFQAENGTC